KIVLEQIDERQIRVSFAVRDGEGLQYEEWRAAIQPDEFIKEPRLADARFTYHADDLTMSCSGLFQCALQMLYFTLSPDKAGQPASSGDLQRRAEGTDADYFVHAERRTDAVDLRV